jgi:hypothetical protein
MGLGGGLARNSSVSEQIKNTNITGNSASTADDNVFAMRRS